MKSAKMLMSPNPSLRFTCLLALLLSVCGSGFAREPEQAPPDRLLTDNELVSLFDAKAHPDATVIGALYRNDPEEGLKALAAYLREAYSERYFFDWKQRDARFEDYRKLFRSNEAKHRDLAAIHASLYPPEARWKLPFMNLKGNEVTAYELRHLARQHKVLDMAFVHQYEGGQSTYVDYFTRQVRSLNEAFEAGEFEDDEGGNGVYESFRAGYRVMNWLQIHAFFLGTDDYDWQDQLELVRTLLHTGAILYRKNQAFRYGNHQTRGVVALAMIAILLNEFEGTDTWYEKAMAILGEHLEKEVNPDGFQFERSVHYHIGDIFNFFQVLQLAQLNDFPVPDAWRAKLKAMFDAAVVLARPDRRLPVLQDDTDRPWAEFNEMADFMLLGSILFDDPVINYFASDRVSSTVYWLLRQDQVAAIAGLTRKRPDIGSAELADTGYYVMRGGWDQGDYHMVVSAGLSKHKPDHQHGDMLGLVARANGQEILPNYQVRYSLPDYAYFKNSFVKNVTLVDGIPHGRGWLGNKGGSGFGKWESLPNPEVITWLKSDDWAFFSGTHDGYRQLGVECFRNVLFLDGLGWLVRDAFVSTSGSHSFQQVWQGHYSDENGASRHRSTFADGSGLEVLQLLDVAGSTSGPTRRGKGNLVYSIAGERGGFLTLLYPFRSFSNRLPDAFFSDRELKVNSWTVRMRGDSDIGVIGFETDAEVVIGNGRDWFLFGASRLKRGGYRADFGERVDFRLTVTEGAPIVLTSLWHETVDTGAGQLEPGVEQVVEF